MNLTPRCPEWICCQLGAREHYAIPRSLQAAGRLRALCTEAWVSPNKLLTKLQRSLKERFHEDLADAQIFASNYGTILFETMAKTRRLRGWPLVLERNRRFQRRVLDVLKRLEAEDSKLRICEDLKGSVTNPENDIESEQSNAREQSARPILFSYSYTALEPFRWAKSRGWTTVLGQIDGGIGDEHLMIDLYRRTAQGGEQWKTAPPEYWNNWREECFLADHIIVNSTWSRSLLIEAGINEAKLRVVPLAYKPPDGFEAFVRQYPGRFTRDRPLRVLFLGRIDARKGATELMTAMQQLIDAPVEFCMVGRVLVDVPIDLKDNPCVRWIGAVPRGDVARWFQQADVFLFPTHCDGFGLTQLEAQSWKLPLISSHFCGDVVRANVNGLKLAEVTPAAIVDAIQLCLKEPQRLAAWSSNATRMSEFNIERLTRELLSLDSPT